MAEAKREPDSAGERGAPEVFHQALDQLYQWMSDNGYPDGKTTLIAEGQADEPVVCADLSIVVYYIQEAEVEEPPGGTAPGGTAPGGTAPGGTAPGGTAPGGAAPGWAAPSMDA